jgi:hypothetical protein
MDDRSWGMEVGVLITSRQAAEIVDILKDYAKANNKS